MRRQKSIANWTAFMAVFLCLGGTAHPSPVVACGPYEDIANALAAKYHEAPIATGIINEHSAMVIFASDKGTFTTVIRGDSGIACIMTTGADWETMTVIKGTKS